MTKPTTLTDEALQSLCRNGIIPDNVVIIDIREPYEYASEHIPGSINVPAKQLATFNAAPYKDKIAIFHCSSGNRTQAAESMISNLDFLETYCLPKGLQQWKQCQLPVKQYGRVRMDIMRQVQITAGTLVVTGVLLGYTLSSYFYLLSLFVGSGLIYAGASGTCGMALLLSYMPWNRVSNSKELAD